MLMSLAGWAVFGAGVALIINGWDVPELPIRLLIMAAGAGVIVAGIVIIRYDARRRRTPVV